MHLTIYNRWGKYIFSTTNITEGWDGTFNNKPLNSGVYVYYVTGELTNGEAINQKGSVILIR